MKKYIMNIHRLEPKRGDMARGKLQFLRDDEIRAIHDTSTRVLEEVGVAVHSPDVTKAVVDAGGRSVNDRVLIPRELVKSSLASAPKSILLAARDGEYDIRIPDHQSLHVANGGEGVFVKDLVTKGTRPSTIDDVRDFTRLVHMLPQIDFCWLMVGAIDLPAETKGLIEFKTMWEQTSKHIQGGASSIEEAKATVAMASVLSGGPDELARRPIMSAVQCPISPLKFEKGLVEAQAEYSRCGIPVVAMAAAVMGLTAPATISGTLAQINAENLASLVISQTARKGAPWIYSSDSVPGDLRTGSIDYGALEAQLLRTGAGEMARFYGLPAMTTAVGIEETSLLLGRAREGIPYMAMMALVPSDLSSGMGGVEEAAGGSYEQLVAEAWIWDLAKEFIRDFKADAAAISFETIRDAGLDGNFLSKRHTLARFKMELVSPRKPEAAFSGSGEAGPRGALIKRAKEEAKRLLSTPSPPMTTRDESERLRAIVETASR